MAEPTRQAMIGKLPTSFDRVVFRRFSIVAAVAFVQEERFHKGKSERCAC